MDYETLCHVYQILTCLLQIRKWSHLLRGLGRCSLKTVHDFLNRGGLKNIN